MTAGKEKLYFYKLNGGRQEEWRQNMDSVGFYAECKGYSSMSLWDLYEYIFKKGNIIDTPELIE